MKNIIGWVIGLGIIWFVFFGYNSLVSSGNTVNNSLETSPVNSSDSSDNNTESNQDEANIDTSATEFNGYPCTVDCSGHEAGYDWAQEHGITQEDVDNYSGNSNSFMEGMQSYVDEN